MNISWSQLENNSKSKELSFESFCFQLAVKKYENYGTFEDYYNTPGSEFYLTLKNDCAELNAKRGDVIGWQAKFWLNKTDEDNSPLDNKHRIELGEGLKKSITYKENLKCWIICTPGKFSNTKPNCPYDKLLGLLKDVNNQVQIEHWHRDVFESFFHSDQERYNSIFNVYFNSKLIGKELLNKVTKHNLMLLEKKFDVDLHVRDESESRLLSYILYSEVKNQIKNHIKVIDDFIDDHNKDYRIKWDDIDLLPKEFLDLINSYFARHVNVLAKIKEVFSSTYDVINIITQIESLLKDFINNKEPDRLILNSKLSEIFVKDSLTNNNLRCREWVEFMINETSDLKDLLISKKEENSLLHTVERVLSNEMHVFGAAGFGKTHFACSLAYQMIEKGVPCLLLLGSSFKDILPPKSRILQLLELSDSYRFNDLICAINNLGLQYNCKIPIIIDGLNESIPTAGKVWNREIKSLLSVINDYSNVILITTCREKEEYIQKIIDEESYKAIKNHIYLSGFNNKNNKYAVEKYFKKYDIIPTSKNYVIDLFKTHCD